MVITDFLKQTLKQDVTAKCKYSVCMCLPISLCYWNFLRDTLQGCDGKTGTHEHRYISLSVMCLSTRRKKKEFISLDFFYLIIYVWSKRCQAIFGPFCFYITMKFMSKNVCCSWLCINVLRQTGYNILTWLTNMFVYNCLFEFLIFFFQSFFQDLLAEVCHVL